MEIFSYHPMNFQLLEIRSIRKKNPVELYRNSMRDYDLLFSSGQHKEARRALRLSSAAVNNGCCLEFLVLPLVRSYLNSKERSDYKIFYLIQVVHYLLHKNPQCFLELAEKDMVDDLIEESWHELLNDTENGFVFLSPFEKIELFRNKFISFPF